MNILNQLSDAATSPESLHEFIQQNFTELYDFCITQSFSELKKYKDIVEQFIMLNNEVYEQLDFNDGNNSSFISILLAITERLALITEFDLLYKLANREGIDISKRVIASANYLVNIHRFNDYINRIETVVSLLKEAYEDEDEAEDNILACILHYYGQVVNNASTLQQKINFREKLILTLQNSSNWYVPIVEKVLDISLEDESTHRLIQDELDLLLDRRNRYLPTTTHDFIIECNSDYSEMLLEAPINFDDIRNVSVQMYQTIQNDAIWRSLDRGKAIIESPEQLLAYYHSFGPMHKAKLMDGLSGLPNEVFNHELELIDWGCGQGFASMMFFQYLLDENLQSTIHKVTLIEPSEIALQRAALHVRKFNNNVEIYTINNILDKLSINDFSNVTTRTKIHLFSNILDIDFFSMTELIQLIKTSFSGENYFVCVSPYISETKRTRINNFVKAFDDSATFQLLKCEKSRRGEWLGSWTKIIRVFKVAFL